MGRGNWESPPPCINLPLDIKEEGEKVSMKKKITLKQVFEAMFERVNGVFGCRTRLSNVLDNQIPRSRVRTLLQTLVCRTAFDEPFDRIHEN
ncbi:hypothetical protein SK128_022451 [Halocaridina rubra]|uniref:Uncharacterized protein n=1 Tax=Halocaridina rubra TaxID=373956 RepID=A0AAN8WZJ1_HALRR